MRYIIYTRKSTEEDDRQVLSIEAQLVELKEFAAKEKLEIVASFQEAKTAKEPEKYRLAETPTKRVGLNTFLKEIFFKLITFKI